VPAQRRRRRRRCVAKWDVDTGACELRLRRHALGVRALARLDANAVLSGSLDMTARRPTANTTTARATATRNNLPN
jgi:hypothetical protein